VLSATATGFYKLAFDASTSARTAPLPRALFTCPTAGLRASRSGFSLVSTRAAVRTYTRCLLMQLRQRRLKGTHTRALVCLADRLTAVT
jgi:hypothetical protein